MSPLCAPGCPPEGMEQTSSLFASLKLQCLGHPLRCHLIKTSERTEDKLVELTSCTGWSARGQVWLSIPSLCTPRAALWREGACLAQVGAEGEHSSALHSAIVLSWTAGERSGKKVPAGDVTVCRRMSLERTIQVAAAVSGETQYAPGILLAQKCTSEQPEC